MDQLGHLTARRAFSAGVSARRIAAIQILHIRKGKGKGAASLILIHEHCMSHPAAVRHRGQGLDDLCVSYYIGKPHYIALLAVK
jgi:hypothetical protein